MKNIKYLWLGLALLSIGWITPNPNSNNFLVASRDILPASSDTHDVGTPANIFKGGYFRFIDLKETLKPETPIASRPYIFASTDGHVYSREIQRTSRQLGQAGTTLLHFNDSLLDSASSDRIFVSADNANVTTSQSKFGGGSLALDGTGDYLSAGDSPDWNFGSGDFTIDFWIKFNSTTNYQYLLNYTDGSNGGMIIRKDNGHKLEMIFNDANGSGIVRYRTTSAITFGTGWHHIAFVRNGVVGLIFLDGVSQAVDELAAFGTQSVFGPTATLYIGSSAVPDYSINGWIDELRISKGIARWTSNFTPPVKEY